MSRIENSVKCLHEDLKYLINMLQPTQTETMTSKRSVPSSDNNQQIERPTKLVKITKKKVSLISFNIDIIL